MESSWNHVLQNQHLRYDQIEVYSLQHNVRVYDLIQQAVACVLNDTVPFFLPALSIKHVSLSQLVVPLNAFEWMQTLSNVSAIRTPVLLLRRAQFSSSNIT